LTGDEEKQLNRRYTNDPAAYLLFREGRYHWNKYTEEGMDLAIKNFQAAIKKDPKFALAYAWQARAYLILHRFRDPEENRIRAKESAAQALMLDENLEEGHATLGAVLFFLDLDWRQAQTELRQALALDPKTSNRHLYGETLAATGNLKEAIKEIEQSVKDDPRYVMANWQLANAFLFDKQYQAALTQARKTLEIFPNHIGALETLGKAYAQLQEFDKAIATFQEALKFSKDDPRVLGWLGYTYGLASNRLEGSNAAATSISQSAQPGLWHGRGIHGTLLILLHHLRDKRSPDLSNLESGRMDVLFLLVSVRQFFAEQFRF
jgi:tetratricopeptide (TPR) repeat protein